MKNTSEPTGSPTPLSAASKQGYRAADPAPNTAAHEAAPVAQEASEDFEMPLIADVLADVEAAVAYARARDEAPSPHRYGSDLDYGKD